MLHMKWSVNNNKDEIDLLRKAVKKNSNIIQEDMRKEIQKNATIAAENTRRFEQFNEDLQEVWQELSKTAERENKLTDQMTKMMSEQTRQRTAITDIKDSFLEAIERDRIEQKQQQRQLDQLIAEVMKLK